VTRDVANELTREIAKNATERGVERVANESFDKIPSGLPLAPPITAWYATTNVWHVTVRGEYARFGIGPTAADPANPGVTSRTPVTGAQSGWTSTTTVNRSGWGGQRASSSTSRRR